MELILDSNVSLLYSVMAFAGALMVLIICISNVTVLSNKNKNLRMILYWVVFFCIQDGIWGLFASRTIYNDLGLTIVSYIFHLSAIFSCPFWIIYFLSRVKDVVKKPKIYISITCVLTAVQVGMLVGNLFTKFMFFVNDKHEYETTSYRKIMFYIQFAQYIIIAVVSLISTIRNKKPNVKTNFLAIFLVNMSPIVSGIFQMIYPDAPYDSLGFTIGAIIIHTFLTRDYEKQVYDLNILKEELNAALEKTEVANKAKTTFLFNMSHDIRTPMNAITGFTTMAKNHLDDKEVVSNYLEKIEVAGNQLLTLINQVLEMSRIEAGKLTLSNDETDLFEINNVLDVIFSEQADAKSINFKVECHDLVHNNVIIDEERLKQIIMNILNNSLKYTYEGGCVTYTLTELPCDEPGYGLYSFNVTDTGIGMSEEFLNHIFDEFSRENTSTVSKIQGTGLGMSIVKRLTDLLSGSIEITSKKDCGTTIVVNIPMKINDKVSVNVASTEVDEISLSGMKVLLVEDNELNSEIAIEILTSYGIVVDLANDGDIAVEKVACSLPGTYDLVLMDVQMPRMNGYEATKAIRNLGNKELAGIPIIAMTANAFEEDKKNALAAGMNGHLAKPIDITKLIDTISKFKRI